MWPSILALIGFLIVLTILGFAFLIPLIEVGANAIVLYFLFLRIHTEITKYNRQKMYLVSFVIAAVFLQLAGNFLPLWWITAAGLLTFLFVHVYLMTRK